jgi:PAS domain S-box-containing protein
MWGRFRPGARTSRVAGRFASPGVARLGLLFVAYVLAGTFGLSYAASSPVATTIWPPTGIALAAALLWGPAVLPVVALAAATVNALVAGPHWMVLTVALGNTAEIALGWALVTRFAGGADFLRSGRGAFSFSLLAGFAAPVVAALIGALSASVRAGDFSEFDTTMAVWWLGDAGGAHLVTPLILAIARPEPGWAWTLRRRGEWALLLAFLALTVFTVFFSPLGVGHQAYPLAFLVLPLAVWAAFRFRAREAALVNLLVAVAVIGGTLMGLGPFATNAEPAALLVVQVFLNIVCMTSLPLTAGVFERRAALQALDAARSELEARVAERTAALDEAQAAAHVGTWRWDLATDAIIWSDEMHRLFGLTPGSVKLDFATYARLLTPEDAATMQAKVQRCLETGEPYQFEHRLRHDDGRVAWLDGRGHAVRDAQGQVIRLVGTGQDITERKRAEDEVRKLTEELERRIESRTQELARANAELESFNYSVSHDLRGPLRNIGGFAEILLEELGPGATELTKSNLNRIVTNARRMNDIITGMLALANAGRGALELGPVDLSRLAEQAVADLQEAAPERVVRVDIEPGLQVHGDRRLLRVLVSNLLSNAWKFTGRLPPGEARVTFGLETGPNGPEVVVRDNGAGFDPNLGGQLFLPFRRLHQRSEFDGTGIGLATVARIAERHGGDVRAEGRVGGGATFCVHLPGLVGTQTLPPAST